MFNLANQYIFVSDEASPRCPATVSRQLRLMNLIGQNQERETVLRNSLKLLLAYLLLMVISFEIKGVKLALLPGLKTSLL
jgi:hypothetical protein